MSLITQVRHQLKDLGFRPNMVQEIDTLSGELHLTICQVIVVILSILSVALLFTPLLFIGNFTFILIFFGVSLVFLIAGMWFWVKRAEICENPQDVRD